jgi:hypothetical protein
MLLTHENVSHCAFHPCDADHKKSDVIGITDSFLDLTYHCINVRCESHVIIKRSKELHILSIFLCSEQTRGNPGTQSNGTNEVPGSMSAEPPERFIDVH